MTAAVSWSTLGRRAQYGPNTTRAQTPIPGPGEAPRATKPGPGGWGGRLLRVAPNGTVWRFVTGFGIVEYRLDFADAFAVAGRVVGQFGSIE